MERKFHYLYRPNTMIEGVNQTIARLLRVDLICVLESVQPDYDSNASCRKFDDSSAKYF